MNIVRTLFGLDKKEDLVEEQEKTETKMVFLPTKKILNKPDISEEE